MLKKTIIIVAILSLIGCSAQKNTTMEKFDIERFNENKNHLNEFKFIKKDSTVIEQMELKDIYSEDIIFKDSYFIKKSQYYKNGFLKITGLFFDSSFKQGIWKEFDEQGKLIKETDYDKGFDYTWEDLVKYLEERKVDIKGRYTTIRKEEGNWRFSYVEGIYIYDVIIDGKTGKIIQDAKNEFEEGS
ncbi:hypothetical protein [Bizionia paragorgiae]|uniref:MORN repeat variant n=1 Tax=Bizionia paragorgiae TaxID=283786 RepID=A0A1H4BYB0_BIZPA|nr:hypothetical protein [Bizionia paragorgiae]SEA53064.1 hypothetical protein SAMN04487990_1172 [Bizionia paragorgiae]